MREIFKAESKLAYLTHNSNVRRWKNLLSHLDNWGEFLLWKLSKYKRPKTFTARLRNGFEVPLRGEQRHEFKLMFMSHEYFWPIPDREWVGAIIDLGANVGFFTLFSAYKFPNCQVLSFEPFPRNFGILNENIRRNQLRNCSSFQCAVSNKSGEVVFGINSERENPTDPKICDDRSVAEDNEAFFRVPCLTLNDVIEQNNIDKIAMLKIDIEGAEYDVLYSLSDKNLRRIQRIGIETEDIDTKDKNTPALRSFLEANGFETKEVTPHLVHAWQIG